jgi:GNAT superfamily N-acetyltransferase
MSYEVRQVDFREDRKLLTQILSEFLTPEASGPRFAWLYEKNPHGPARAWVAIEKDTGKGLAAAATFPRRLWVDGTVQRCCVLGDFCVDPQYRSLGLALQMQRACLEYVNSASCVFGYDFPSAQMMAIYQRLQIAPASEMVRWAKPLRAERKLGEMLKYPVLTRGLSLVLNTLLEWRDAATSVPRNGWIISEQGGEYGEEFTALARLVGSRAGICTDRSADYLNWRYGKHPLRRYEMLTARRNGALTGYVIFSQSSEDAAVVDWFGLNDTSMWAVLVTELVALLRGRGIITLSASTQASHPLVPLLTKLGFRARESCPVVVYASRNGEQSADNIASHWMLTDGDRES